MLYPALIQCLDFIVNNKHTWVGKTIVEANGFLSNIMSPSFIAAFKVNLHVFGYTKPLSILLQGSTMDILTAYQEIKTVKLYWLSFEEIQRRSLTQFMQEWSQWLMQLAWKQCLFQGDVVGFRQQGIMWNHQHLKSNGGELYLCHAWIMSAKNLRNDSVS